MRFERRTREPPSGEELAPVVVQVIYDLDEVMFVCLFSVKPTLADNVAYTPHWLLVHEGCPQKL